MGASEAFISFIFVMESVMIFIAQVNVKLTGAKGWRER